MAPKILDREIRVCSKVNLLQGLKLCVIQWEGKKQGEAEVIVCPKFPGNELLLKPSKQV